MVSLPRRHAALLLLVLCVLSGCSAQPESAIVFAVPTAARILDPRLASDAASERINALLYERLVELDPQGHARPGMASWRQLTPRHFRFSLLAARRPFTNGRLPNAEDVVATYRSVLDPQLGSPHAGALAHIAAINALPDGQIDFLLRRADPQFPAHLGVGIVAAEALRGEASARLARAPQGSGSFAFLRWRDDGAVVLQRRSDGQRVVFEPVADPTMRSLKLIRGEANLVQNDLPSELYDYLAERPSLRVAQRSGTTFAYIGFNFNDPVLADRRVREAIAHAIDRESIVRYLFAGRAEAAEAILRPEHWAGVSGLPAYRFDPSLSRRLLGEAGYSDATPLRLSYKTSTDPFRLRLAHVFQQQLADVGIALSVSSYEWGTFFGDIKAGRFQLYSLSWVGVDTPDILRYAFHSASMPPSGANRGGYRNAEVDRLLDRAATLAPEQAAPLYAAAQRKLHEDLVYVPLWYESNMVASNGVVGYRPAIDGSYLALNEAQRSDAQSR